MIRVSVPIDEAMVARTASNAFALATPLRVEDVLRLGVVAALGQRAPEDKRERGVRTALTGFREGRFVVDIDGRRYGRLDDIVVCAGSVTLRFYSGDAERSLAAG